PFDLDLTVRSHGFYDLAPWHYDADRRVLARPLRLASGRVVRAEVAEGPGGLLFRALAAGRLGPAEAGEARGLLRRCLSLDDDLAGFRAAAEAAEARRAAGTGRDLPDLRWALQRGAGRLLRSPTVWEDAVKTLCTTNCSWALTRAMVARLCEALGEAGPGGERAFPTPEALAARPERFFRDVVRAGYRAPFLRGLARAVAAGRLDLEGWRTGPLDGAGLRAALLEVDGFGPYAAEHLARLLGRHDFPALDAWTREKLRTLRGMRRPPAERTVRRWYAAYGPWAGLAMWLEVTADWFGDRSSWP
ncbi:MAG TPA: Fe-S cluster assembly protein HesB, partial [Anaeromyxobacteraceae bacterium]